MLTAKDAYEMYMQSIYENNKYIIAQCINHVAVAASNGQISVRIKERVFYDTLKYLTYLGYHASSDQYSTEINWNKV